ncbi:MAG: SDR family oxidoreductase [Rhodospirillaceae bacterium]|nr:SDR family oxidoreductase [Rhodospirillaceae bacterium]
MPVVDYTLDFTGKVALVVGGSSGIGNATAQAFRNRGAVVSVWGTRPSAADYAGDDGSDLTGVRYVQMDVRDLDAIEAYSPPFETLDALVLCQGCVLYKRQEFQMDGFQDVLTVNLTSLMACIMKFRPLLEASQGSVVVVSSAAAFHATVGNPAYAASKSGAVGLTRTLAQGFAAKGVRINSLAPGFIPTKMTTVTTENPARADATKTRIPMGRFGTPEEMAAAILFLVSPLASYITGQTLVADGGMLL